jgi:hypothetical protein
LKGIHGWRCWKRFSTGTNVVSSILISISKLTLPAPDEKEETIFLEREQVLKSNTPLK